MSHAQLRNNNRTLLEKLKFAQNDIKENILWQKHGDFDKFSHPMSSTLAEHHASSALQASLKNSQSLLRHAKSTLAAKKSCMRRTTPSHRSSLNSERQTDQRSQMTILKEQKNDDLFKSVLNDDGNIRPTHHKGCRRTPIKSPLKNTKVHFDLETSVKDEKEAKSNVDRPLLGYDWIAGMMDVKSQQTTDIQRPCLDEVSDNYLSDIMQFRSMNRDDCSGRIAPWREPSFTPIKTRKRATSPNPADTGDLRISDFTVNSRLFPVPVDGSDVQPGTYTSPRYIRISVPKAVLATPYKYKPKTELASFDSLALPHHCKPGHEYTAESAKPVLPQTSPHLDLRTSMRLENEPYRRSTANLSSSYNKSLSQDFLNDSYALQYKLLKLKK